MFSECLTIVHLQDAIAFRDSHIVDVDSYDMLKQAVAEGKWARCAWAASDQVRSSERSSEGCGERNVFFILKECLLHSRGMSSSF